MRRIAWALLDRPLLWAFMRTRGHRGLRRRIQRAAFWLAEQPIGMPIR